MREHGRIRDSISAWMQRRPDAAYASLGLHGFVVAELRGPDGELKGFCETHNAVTQTGDQYYAERAVAGISGSPVTGGPAQVTGMKLGTGSTAVAKTSTGSFLVTYLDDSHQALASGFPTSSLNSGSRRIQWQAVWAAGKATTALAITEVVLVNESLSNLTSNESKTIARALLTGIGSKGASDTLTITWNHDILGALS